MPRSKSPVSSQSRELNTQKGLAHHGIWGLGVRLFSNLSFRSKAVLISVMFLIPIALLGVQHVRLTGVRLHSDQKSAVGIAYASEILPLLKLIQQQRFVGLLRAEGESGDTEAKALEDAIDAQLKRVDEIDKRHGGVLRTKEALGVLRANMEKATAMRGAKNLLAIHKRNSQSAEAAIALLNTVLDTSGLMLDPEVESHHLMLIGLSQLPQLIEAMLASNDLALATAYGANPQMSARMIAPLHAVGVYLDVQVRQGLDQLVTTNPPFQERFAYAPIQEALAKIDALESGLGEEGWAADPAAMATERNALIKLSTALQSELMSELQLQIKGRIDRLWFESTVMLAILGISMLLAIYMFIAFSRVIQGGLNEVRRHLHAMTDGDLTTFPQAVGKDESAKLMVDLQNMQDSLRKIVSQVRLSSDGIMDASHQIGNGASDLSVRTEQTESSLQRSTDSLKAVGMTVRQTADVAEQASDIGNESAGAALRGGEVIGRVNITMHDIRTSSSKIGEIIGVIDGLAFQTNILALNAAVEAARAGEAGRGFAVVASEVRSLAQRSASAAKEIKGLVSDSIGKVNSGVSVVEEASTAMNAIVSSAQRVNVLIESIAAGTREQARSVTEVEATVHEMDSVTQQNSAMVDQTVAAAGTLDEQARALVARVSHFQLP